MIMNIVAYYRIQITKILQSDWKPKDSEVKKFKSQKKRFNKSQTPVTIVKKERKREKVEAT